MDITVCELYQKSTDKRLTFNKVINDNTPTKTGILTIACCTMIPNRS